MKYARMFMFIWSFALFGMEDDLQPIYMSSSQLKLAQEKPENAQLTYAKNGNLFDLQQLIRQHPTLLAHRYAYDVHAIHRAAQHGHTEIVKFFISQDLQLADATTSRGCHTMHYAAASGCMPLLQYLTELNRDYMQVKNNRKHEPIHFAISYDKLESVQFFLQQGATTYEMAFTIALMYGPLSFFNKLLPYFIIRVDRKFNTQEQSNKVLQSWLKDAARNKYTKVPFAILRMGTAAYHESNKEVLWGQAAQVNNTKLIKALENE